jgi:proline racemase
MVTLKTIDAHAAGGPLRLVVDGFPAPRGRTMAEKAGWVGRHADHLRRLLMCEPRACRHERCGADWPVASGRTRSALMNASGYRHCPATASSRSRRLRSNAAS